MCVDPTDLSLTHQKELLSANLITSLTAYCCLPFAEQSGQLGERVKVKSSLYLLTATVQEAKGEERHQLHKLHSLPQPQNSSRTDHWVQESSHSKGPQRAGSHSDVSGHLPSTRPAGQSPRLPVVGPGRTHKDCGPGLASSPFTGYPKASTPSHGKQRSPLLTPCQLFCSHLLLSMHLKLQ